MKLEKFLKRAVCVLFMILITILSAFEIFAVDLDGDGIDDVVSTETPYAEETTAYVEPETEPYIETTAYVEPETEPYVEETTVYVESVTETAQVQTEFTTQYVEPDVQVTTVYIAAPTVAKTVSQKKYTTNYTAGIVSWICVGIGVLVVAAVLISNKISGRKANRRR